ncbi:alpha/beta fold hydrolase [Sphingosinithalassobacter portus]|uniref:alpha/beta fold hydrolase n=1 Tax=Stakelama portus TaxID=2676234 RepID=UPI000D6DFBD7|nr:alpha/beta hydrolase [Sphingosinithalassobacter portus]
MMRTHCPARKRDLFLSIGLAVAMLIYAGATRAETGPATAPAAATAMAAQDAEVRMDHISIVTRGAQSGQTVIFIPGLSSPRAVWDGSWEAVAQDHPVALVQVNGFAGGAPGANLEPGVIDGIVADIAAYIRDNNIEKPAVIGHSMGGLVAMKLALTHPDLIGRILVVDAMPFFGVVMGAPDVASIEPRAAQMRDMMIAQYETVRAAAQTPVTSDPGGNLSMTPEGRIKVANWSMQADTRVVAQALYEDMTMDLRGEIAAITMPFTVVYAAGMGEAEAAAVWEPQFAGSQAEMIAIPGAYHFLMLDNRDAFLEAMANFLD